MTNFKGKEETVNYFIKAVAYDQWANWSDMISLRLKEISEKEIGIEDKAREISDLFEEYRNFGYTEGIKEGLKMALLLIEKEGLAGILKEIERAEKRIKVLYENELHFY